MIAYHRSSFSTLPEAGCCAINGLVPNALSMVMDDYIAELQEIGIVNIEETTLLGVYSHVNKLV